MKKILLVVVLAIAGYSLLRCTPAGQRALARMEESNEAGSHLRKAEAQINAMAPKMLDQFTRVDGAKAGPGKRFTYLYTIVNVNSSTIDTTAWRNQVAPALKRQIKKTGGVRSLFEAGITVTYRYSAADGASIGEIIITPAEGLSP